MKSHPQGTPVPEIEGDDTTEAPNAGDAGEVLAEGIMDFLECSLMPWTCKPSPV